MRKHIRLLCLIMSILLLATAAGCNAKAPITPEAYQDKMTNLGYEVFDISQQFSQHPHIVKALGNQTDNIHMEFYEIDTIENCSGVYSSNKTSIESLKRESATESVTEENDYKKYTLLVDERYYTIVQVNTTFLYSYCQEEDVAKLDTILKDLGY